MDGRRRGDVVGDGQALEDWPRLDHFVELAIIENKSRVQ